MKISKLFHWLYAFLMFLPIVLFIPNAFYYGFNEHATNSETTTINYKYQSNEVNDIDTDLVQYNIYYFDKLNFTATSDYSMDFNIITTEIFLYTSNNNSIEEIYVSEYDCNVDNFINVISDDYSIYLYFSNSNGYSFISLENASLDLRNCIIQVNNVSALVTWYNYFGGLGNFPKYTDYNVIENVEINTNDAISNKMYQAWQSTWNLPLLQWTHTSFVAQPFTYITGLFGVPSDSTFNYIFAYFVSISICWLVFDLIMYVPNLAHRWLDKGALE